MSHAAFVAVSAADIAALYLAAGIVAMLLWAGRAARPSPSPRIAGITAACTAILAADTLLILLQRSHVMGGLPYGRLWPLLPQVLWDTHFGHVWLLRAAAVAALAWGWRGLRRAPDRRAAAAAAVPLAVIAFTRSATGHSADQGDWTVAELVDLLHIVSGIAWAGAVVAAAVLWAGTDRARGAGFAGCAQALSQLATAGLAGVAVTGSYNAWLHLERLPALWETDYGRHLGWKLVLVGIMAGLGAINRFFHLPHLEAAGAGDAAAQFQRNLYVEAWVAVAVFAAAAVLINTPPPHAGMSAMPGMVM